MMRDGETPVIKVEMSGRNRFLRSSSIQKLDMLASLRYCKILSAIATWQPQPTILPFKHNTSDYENATSLENVQLQGAIVLFRNRLLHGKPSTRHRRRHAYRRQHFVVGWPDTLNVSSRKIIGAQFCDVFFSHLRKFLAIHSWIKWGFLESWSKHCHNKNRGT